MRPRPHFSRINGGGNRYAGRACSLCHTAATGVLNTALCDRCARANLNAERPPNARVRAEMEHAAVVARARLAGAVS